MKLKKDDTLADVNILTGDIDNNTSEYVLAVTANGYGKRIRTGEFKARGRGGVGVIATKFKKTPKVNSGQAKDSLSCLRAIHEEDEVLTITAQGVIVRQKVSAISTQSRSATGVMVQKVDDGDAISSLSIVPSYEESDD